jgi:predicted RNase H-like HicB family nuclease
MKNIIINIGRSKDHFSAYADNVDGIYGAGNTVAEARENILEAIGYIKKRNNPEKTAAILNGEYKLLYKYDTESFLKYYKGIFTNTAISRLTGINEK